MAGRRVASLVLCVAICTLGAGLGAPAGAQGDGSSPAEAVAATEQVLGVVSARGGSFDGKHLTLTGVQPQLTWFSDRPARRAGLLDTASLEEAFFARQVPPNAALVLDGSPASRDVVVVELSKARYDSNEHRLSFATKVVKPDDVFRVVHPRLSEFADRSDAKIPKRFDASALFIDTAPASTQTPDQAAVAQLSSQFGTFEYDWGHILADLQQCLNAATADVINEMLERAGGQISSFEDLYQELGALQQAVANGGSLSPAQEQQLGQLQAAVPTNQTLISQYQDFINRADETGFC